MDYKSMSKKQLHDEINKLEAVRMEAKRGKLEIKAILDRRTTETKVAGMSETEKDNLRQVLSPRGIKSGEAVGTLKI